MQAIIDLGSNSIRLSIYQFIKGVPELVLSKKKTVGLSSYINEDGCMSSFGIAAAIKTVNEFKKILKSLNIKKKYVIATAAIRNATNSHDILIEIKKKTRLNIELITGEDEAIYDLKGVLLMENFDTGIILDIGGGSTEIVIYEQKNIKQAFSIPVGSLNSYMMFVENLIPSKSERKKLELYVEQLLQPHLQIVPEGYTMYGVGGSMRGTLKLSKHMFKDDTHNQEITNDMLKTIIKASSENKNTLLPILQTIPERIHTITTGMIVAKVILKVYQSKLVIVNYYGLREGYMYQKFMDAKLKRKNKVKPYVIQQP